MKPVLIAPRHQVTAWAELQFLQRQSFHADLDRLHRNAAFGTPVVPEYGINGRNCGIAILLRHETNLLLVTRLDSL
jgi:hypothetical protein